MRHRVKGRKLNRNGSHRKAMFSNMAASLIKTLDQDDASENRAQVAGRIVTTVPKAKELRPRVEKLVTMAKKAAVIQADAEQYASTADRGSDEWKQWRTSERWQQWSQAIAPAITLRRRAFSILRDDEAVTILFDELAERFEDRPGGYTRVIRLATPRLGDAGQRALIEFVGENDRVRRSKAKASLAVRGDSDSAAGAPEDTSDASEVLSDESTGGTVVEAESDNVEVSESGDTSGEKSDS